MRTKQLVPILVSLFSLTFHPPGAGAQGDDDVWPTGVNGPKVWPPQLDNPFWKETQKYPEGGFPPPVDLFSRIRCPAGTAKVKIKNATSGAWERSRWHPPEYAFDDYPASRWSTPNKNSNWLTADMEVHRTIKRLYLIWETAFGKDYDIRVSNDNVQWTTVKEVRGGNGQADVLNLDVAGRYVQLWGLATGTKYGYSLYEFSICATVGKSGVSAPTGSKKS